MSAPYIYIYIYDISRLRVNIYIISSMNATGKFETSHI